MCVVHIKNNSCTSILVSQSNPAPNKFTLNGYDILVVGSVLKKCDPS